MPIVYPQPQPKQTGWDMAGYFLGDNARAARDVLLQALAGQLGAMPMPTSPSPGNMGKIGFPSGASSSVSPSEMSQISSMGGAPNQQGGVTPVSYSPPTKWGIGQSTHNQYLQSLINRQSGGQSSGGAGLPAGGSSIYQPGDVITRGGKQYEVVGFDADGMPMVEPR